MSAERRVGKHKKGPLGTFDPGPSSFDIPQVQEVIVGRETSVVIDDGTTEEVRSKARTVNVSGLTMSVPGGEGEEIPIDEASKIMPESLKGKVKRSLGKDKKVKIERIKARKVSVGVK